ncbi:MAG: hypothetical protein WAL04_15570 [Acidimicrobiales bacterium]|jgi:uncharacterized membrane protein YhaH (DUF805 family)
MSKKGLIVERSVSVRAGGRAGLGWVDICWSAFLVLLVSFPTMTVEEDWHGSPMIDQPGHLWIAAAVLVSLAFLAGGALIGYRRPYDAARHGAAVGAVSVAVLLVGALARRYVLEHGYLPHAVVALWGIGTVGSLALCVMGSQIGRRLAPAHAPDLPKEI